MEIEKKNLILLTTFRNCIISLIVRVLCTREMDGLGERRMMSEVT